jgi:hypothetical protein
MFAKRTRKARLVWPEDRRVVIFGVHVERDRAGHADLGGIAAVEQPPDALVAAKALRAKAIGWPRPSSYRHTASGASPRPASSARTVSAVTPGWSPSISTSTSPRTTSSAAAIEDEHPDP